MDHIVIKIQGAPHMVRPDNKHGIILLGNRLHSQGSTKPSSNHRMSKVEGLFYSKYAKLKKQGHIANKLKAWSTIVVPSVTHDSGTWLITKGLIEAMRTWELQLLRKIIPYPHQESLQDYYIHSATILDMAREMHKEPHLIHVLLDNYVRNVHRQLHTNGHPRPRSRPTVPELP